MTDTTTEYEVKPQAIKNREKFEDMAMEYLGKLTEYKKMKARMDILDASLKKYMLDNNMEDYKNDNGKLTMIVQNRRVLDRSLIDEIGNYMVDSKVNLMFKSPN